MIILLIEYKIATLNIYLMVSLGQVRMFLLRLFFDEVIRQRYFFAKWSNWTFDTFDQSKQSLWRIFKFDFWRSEIRRSDSLSRSWSNLLTKNVIIIKPYFRRFHVSYSLKPHYFQIKLILKEIIWFEALNSLKKVIIIKSYFRRFQVSFWLKTYFFK